VKLAHNPLVQTKIFKFSKEKTGRLIIEIDGRFLFNP